MDEGLSHSLISGNQQVLDEATILQESVTMGLSAFNPDMMYEQVTQNFQMAKQIYGERLLQAIAGTDPNALQRNLRYPEYKREFKERLKQTMQHLHDDGLMTEEGTVTEKGIELASAALYIEELDNLEAKGLGEKLSRERSVYGETSDIRHYKKHDRYRDIALKQSIKMALRRSHTTLHESDLRVFQRQKKGHITIIYALDASGSMKGDKLRMCKRAGIALSYHAMKQHDHVGLIVFGSTIEASVRPTRDFSEFVKALVKVKAKKQTDVAQTVEYALVLFGSRKDTTKHLVLITDGIPTVGSDPERLTIERVAEAKQAGITTSLVGINLETKSLNFAEQLVAVGGGKFYLVEDLNDVDKIILYDYARL